jgi:hypothetical protein
MNPVVALLVLIALSSAACGQSGGAPEHATEVARARSGSLDVVLLASAAALGRGKETSTIEFRSASDGTLVDVGTVKANATMSMPGMAPMSGAVSVEPTGTAGRFLATSDLSMAGQWQLTVEWDGPAGRAAATFSPMVQ